ncbi:hypothetical protein [uncultured Legionella sp.]|uniref:hypothetical protein n=1 Tax=uncultured Legionella sp. TaxID=210934 RepID=UPI00260D2977|nr:hypothetical protein [uncultured Legionella sp.]
MPLPKEFYYEVKQSSVSYSHNYTGNLDIARMINGEACWIESSSPTVKHPKKLILTDWRKWDVRQRIEVVALLKSLRVQGFALYVWCSGSIKPLEKTWDILDMGQLQIRPVPQEQILIKAQNKLKIGSDKILLLDYHRIDCLLANNFNLPRQLDFKYIYRQAAVNELHWLADIISKDEPRLSCIVDTAYNVKQMKALELLRKALPDVKYTTQFHALELPGEQTNNILDNPPEGLLLSNIKFLTTNAQFDEARLKKLPLLREFISISRINLFAECFFEQGELSQLEVATFKNSQSGTVYGPGLVNFLRAAPNMQHFALHSSIIKDELLLKPGELNVLQKLFLLNSVISPHNLQRLLSAVPKLKVLRLPRLEGSALVLKKGCLSELSNVSFDANSTNSELQIILEAAPNIKILHLTECKYITLDFDCIHSNVSKIEDLDLSSSAVTWSSLTRFLKLMPQINRLSLKGCTQLNEESILPELSNLLALNLSYENLSNIQLNHFLKAAPQLKELHLSKEFLCNGSATDTGIYPNVQKIIFFSASIIDSRNLIDGEFFNKFLHQFPNLHCLQVEQITLNSPLYLAPSLQSLVMRYGHIREDEFARTLKSAPLKKLSISNLKIDKLFLEQGCLPSLKHLTLLSCISYPKHMVQTLIKAAPNLKVLILGEWNLKQSLELKPNQLPLLRVLNLNMSQIGIEFLKNLLKAAPNIQNIVVTKTEYQNLILDNELRKFFAKTPITFMNTGSDSDIVSTPLSSNIRVPNDPAHNPLQHREYIPKPKELVFKFQGTNKTKNQSMIKEKLLQYLTLIKENPALISLIPEGICFALSHYFISKSSADWTRFIDSVGNWNGDESTLSAELKRLFGELYSAVKYFYFTSNLNQYYLGTNYQSLLNILEEGQNCILYNPWHAIAVRRDTLGDWAVYDPNYVDGVKSVKSEHLFHTIEASIGHLIAIEFCFLGALIHDPNAFLRDGGLLFLCRANNNREIVDQLPMPHGFTKEALSGILSRDVFGVPSWACGLINHDPMVQEYTKYLVIAFIRAHPFDFFKMLQHSLEVYTPFQRHKLMPHVLGLFSKTEDEYFKTALVDLMRAPSMEALYYEQQLRTWEAKKTLINTVNEYCQQCFRIDGPKKRLITLQSPAAVDHLSYALQTYGAHTSVAVFYVDNPEELICSASYIARTGDKGEMRKGPGGPLYDFLRSHQQHRAVLIINYERFTSDDLLRFDSLLNAHSPQVDGILLPEHLFLIGLTHSHIPQGFDVVEESPLSCERLKEQVPQLPPISAATNMPTLKTIINLYHSADWERRLLGHWQLNRTGLTYIEGELTQALRTHLPIEIHNGLWSDERFVRFWQQLRTRGIWRSGQLIGIPANTPLSYREGYDWSLLVRAVSVHSGLSSEVPLVLNPATLSDFFNRSLYNDTQSLEPCPGLIEEARGGILDVNVPQELSDDVFAMVLAKCLEQNVTLNAYCAFGIVLPEPLNKENRRVHEVIDLAPWKGDSKHLTQIIISTDVDTTVAQLSVASTWQLIDISECKPHDLLTRMDARFNSGELTFELKQFDGALLTALKMQQNIILKGTFSAELGAALAPLILKRQQDATVTSRLILVTPSVEPFAYASCLYAHNVSREEKLHCLDQGSEELEAFLHEPLARLRARQAFIAHHPNISSNESWQGLQKLPHDSLLNALDESVSAQEFTQRRLQIVNGVLAHQPYVFITGLSGVGKSTFVERELCQEGDALFSGVEQMEAWALLSGPGRKILFLDEANLSPREWSEFETLFHNPPSILVNGVVRMLSAEHRVVFAGNPLSYSDERKIPSFIHRHGNARIFNPLPLTVIKEKIITPIFSKQTQIAGEDIEFICTYLLKLYRFICHCSTTEILISPRELEAMALLALVQLKEGSEQSIADLIGPIAYQIAFPLVPKERRDAFDDLFKKESQPLYSVHPMVTASRQPVYQHLLHLLALREWRTEQEGGLNEVQKYGGLGGLLIEGKSDMDGEWMIHSLVTRGYKQEYQLDEPSLKRKLFYIVPVSMGLIEKQNLLLKAFHEGAVVFFKNMNSSPVMEQWLNDLLMGKTPDKKRPLKPGFMLIATTAEKVGAPAVSVALKRRVVTDILPEHNEQELKEMLEAKGLSPFKASELVDVFQNQVNYAREHQLQPVPSLSNLLVLVEQELLKIQQELLADRRITRSTTSSKRDTASVNDSLKQNINSVPPSPFANSLTSTVNTITALNMKRKRTPENRDKPSKKTRYTPQSLGKLRALIPIERLPESGEADVSLSLEQGEQLKKIINPLRQHVSKVSLRKKNQCFILKLDAGSYRQWLASTLATPEPDVLKTEKENNAIFSSDIGNEILIEEHDTLVRKCDSVPVNDEASKMVFTFQEGERRLPTSISIGRNPTAFFSSQPVLPISKGASSECLNVSTFDPK